jgi:hypothetical protein
MFTKNKLNTARQSQEPRRAILMAVAIAVAASSIFNPSRNQPAAQAQSSGDLVIYDDRLAGGWENWSLDAAIDFSNGAPTANGSAASMAIQFNQPWAVALFGAQSPVATAGYDGVAFRAYSAADAQRIRVFAKVAETGQDTPFAEVALLPGVWSEVSVPFSQLGSPTRISAIAIQDGSGSAQPAFFVDDLRLTRAQESAATPTPEATPSVTGPVTATPEAAPTPEATPSAVEPVSVEPTLTPSSADAQASSQYFAFLPHVAVPASELLPIGRFDGPSLYITETEEGGFFLTWTAVPGAIGYNVRYGPGEARRNIIYVPNTQTKVEVPFGFLSASSAPSYTASVVAITPEGVSRELNVIEMRNPWLELPDELVGALNEVAGLIVNQGLGGEAGVASAQSGPPIVLTAEECIDQTINLETRLPTREMIPHTVIRRSYGPAQCLALLANSIISVGSFSYWTCELVTRVALWKSGWGFFSLPFTLSALAAAVLGPGWASVAIGIISWIPTAIILSKGSSAFCNQLKTWLNSAGGRNSVYAVRRAAEACGFGWAEWTTEHDIASDDTLSVYDVECAQAKPVAYVLKDRIVFQDGSESIVDPTRLRKAIMKLMISPEPLTWKKTEAMAHRGDRVSSPDNTAEAVKRAMRKGAKYIEIDVELGGGEFGRFEPKVVVAHGSKYKPPPMTTWNGRGFEIPTVVYGPTRECHGKSLESPSVDFMLEHCDIGTQMAMAREGHSWAPKFRKERYMLLEDLIKKYPNYCGWVIELKGSKWSYRFDPPPEGMRHVPPGMIRTDLAGRIVYMRTIREVREARELLLGVKVQEILQRNGIIERCYDRGQPIWVTSFEDDALDGITDDRIKKIRVVSSASVGDWKHRVAEWLARGYDGVAVDIYHLPTQNIWPVSRLPYWLFDFAPVSEVAEGLPLPEYFRYRGLKAVGYSLLTAPNDHTTNRRAIDKKLDFFLTDVLDDMLYQNGDRGKTLNIQRVTLQPNKVNAIVVRNHEVYPVKLMRVSGLRNYRPEVPGDGWLTIKPSPVPGPVERPGDRPIPPVQYQAVHVYKKPAYDFQSYDADPPKIEYAPDDLGRALAGIGPSYIVQFNPVHKDYADLQNTGDSFSSVTAELITTGVDRAWFKVNGTPVPEKWKVIFCAPSPTQTQQLDLEVKGFVEPAEHWRLLPPTVRVLLNNKQPPSFQALELGDWNRLQVKAVVVYDDDDKIEPRAALQMREIDLTAYFKAELEEPKDEDNDGVPDCEQNKKKPQEDNKKKSQYGLRPPGGGGGGRSGSSLGEYFAPIVSWRRGASVAAWWPLTPQPSANVSGDPHYQTFDNRSFTSMHLGEFVAMTDVLDGSSGLQVQIRHERLPGFPDWASFSTAAVVGYAGHRIEAQIPLTATGPAPLIVLIDGKFSDLLPGYYSLPDPSGSGRSLNFHLNRHGVTVHVPNPDREGELIKIRMGVFDDKFTIGRRSEPFRSLELEVTMNPASSGINRYRGTLGTPNGNAADDMSDRAGNIVDMDAFFEAWRITDKASSLFTYLPPATGPESYNKVQTATVPNFSSFIPQVEAAIRGQCGVTPSLVSEVFIYEMAVELGAGRTITDLVMDGLCQNGQVSAAVEPPPSFSGFQFLGRAQFSRDPRIGVSGASVEITADELNGREVCQRGTFGDGRFECVFTELPKAFGNASWVTMRYTVTGYGTQASGSFTMPVPAAGEWVSRELTVDLTPARILRLTGRAVFSDGTPLREGVVRAYGAVYARYPTGQDGSFDFYVPLPEGATSANLELAAYSEVISDLVAKRRVIVAAANPGVTEVNVPVLVLEPGTPPSLNEATLASMRRHVIFTGKVTNTVTGGSVSGLRVQVNPTGIEAGCETTTDGTGSYVCAVELEELTGFSGEVVVRGLAANQVYTVPFTVSEAEVPMPGGALTKRVDLSAGFDAYQVMFYVGAYNALTGQNSHLNAHSVTASSPELGALSCGRTSCRAFVGVTGTVGLTIDVLGEWGSASYFTETTVAALVGQPTIRVPVSPTTVMLTGRVTQLGGALPLANTGLSWSSMGGSIVGSNWNWTGTDSSGAYTWYVTLKAGVVSDTLLLRPHVENVVIPVQLEGLRLNAFNAVVRSVDLVTRTVNLEAIVTNGHLNDQRLKPVTQFTVTREGQVLCVYGSDPCRLTLDEATPFEAQLAVAGPWGVVTKAHTIDPVALLGGDRLVYVRAYPTVVRIEGQVRDQSGVGLRYARISVPGNSVSLGADSVYAYADGRFRTEVVVRASVTAGPLPLRVEYQDADWTWRTETFTQALSGLVAGGLNTVTAVLTTALATSIELRVAEVRNGHCEACGILPVSRLTVIHDGQALCAAESSSCSLVPPRATPFDVQLVVAGTWGVVTETRSVDPVAVVMAGGAQSFEVTAYPTVVRIDGEVRDRGVGVSNLAVNVMEDYIPVVGSHVVVSEGADSRPTRLSRLA